jgi:hypothetical protein
LVHKYCNELYWEKRKAKKINLKRKQINKKTHITQCGSYSITFKGFNRNENAQLQNAILALISSSNKFSFTYHNGLDFHLYYCLYWSSVVTTTTKIPGLLACCIDLLVLGFTLRLCTVRQMFYCLTQTSSPFVLVILEIRSHFLLANNRIISISTFQVARITIVGHRHPENSWFILVEVKIPT